MSTFKPTFLYIKRHSVTGLMYFGKTTKTNPLTYKGSGKYWLRHIKKHGTQFVETVWFCLYTDPKTLEEAAISLSNSLDVALSESWANLKPENGLDGGSSVGYNGFKGKTHTPEHRRYLSEKYKGHKVTDKVRAAVRETGKRVMKMFNETTITCPHCGKSGTTGPMKRWHFNNCPSLPSRADCPLN